jgi:peptidyl-dipeptidase A
MRGTMTESALDFIEEITAEVKPLHLAYTTAMWKAALSGTEADNEAERRAQARLMRYWSDPDRFERARRLDQVGHKDPIPARCLRVIYLSAAKAQQDEVTIERLTSLEAEVRQTYYNFRGTVDGIEFTDNQLDRVLKESDQSDQVQAAWEASKQVGRQVADSIRQLAQTRNQAAVTAGYRDHYARSLALNEIDEEELFELLAELEAATDPIYRKWKTTVDRERAGRFGVAIEDLGPWHYGDRFFQRAPVATSADLEAVFKDRDPVDLARLSYRGWGLDIDEILDQSDLYPRDGKNQHAFCLDIDREGDVRTLNNLEANRRWAGTLHHELGHAVYDKLIDRELPWLMRKPPHTLSTEAIALLMESALDDPTWLKSVLKVNESQAEQLAAVAAERRRANHLVFTRWVLVMTHFERALYQDPERDLDDLWWELKERFQDLRRPAGRQAPDWAAKYHIALAPVYYQNYQLGLLFMAQLERSLASELGEWIGNGRVGAWLQEHVFHSGARRPWPEHIVTATTQALQPSYFLDTLAD